MIYLSKPKVVISKCLGFSNCRYNGGTENNEFVTRLKDYVDFITVCPEIGMGLGTPREAIRVVEINGENRLFQSKTKRDLTENMNEFAKDFLSSLDEVDGFILKSKSPSCGIRDVKIYPSIEKGGISKRGEGRFSSIIREAYPNITIEDDGRLKNLKIREHFLTKLFTLNRFKKCKESNEISELLKFHKENKLLFMSYNQRQLKALGQILGNIDGREKRDVFNEYSIILNNIFSKVPRYTSNINVLIKSMGYFSNYISHNEKEFIIDTIEKYRSNKVPLSVPLNLIKGYAIRFEKENLLKQSFFNPFPEGLIELSDSGK